jgi:hypothetical protein
MRKALKDFKAGEKCWLPINSEYSLAHLNWYDDLVEGTVLSAPKDGIAQVGFPANTKFAYAKTGGHKILGYDHLFVMVPITESSEAYDSAKDHIAKAPGNCRVPFVYGRELKPGDTFCYASAGRQCYVEVISIEETESANEPAIAIYGNVFRVVSAKSEIVETDRCVLFPNNIYLLIDRNSEEK